MFLCRLRAVVRDPMRAGQTCVDTMLPGFDLFTQFVAAHAIRSSRTCRLRVEGEQAAYAQSDHRCYQGNVFSNLHAVILYGKSGVIVTSGLIILWAKI
jgi:hypothetical protein